jgi:hypothetical protein
LHFVRAERPALRQFHALKNTTGIKELYQQLRNAFKMKATYKDNK